MMSWGLSSLYLVIKFDILKEKINFRVAVQTFFVPEKMLKNAKKRSKLGLELTFLMLFF